jgi:hypothetical protein
VSVIELVWISLTILTASFKPPLKSVYFFGKVVFFLFSDVPIWLIWLKYLSWFLYGFEALLINQWDGIENITCPAEVRLTVL